MFVKFSLLKAWVTVFCTGLFFFYEFIQMNIISSLAPYLMQSFQINATLLGHLSACYFYSTILFLLPAGLILDRFSTRKIILIALMLCITGTFLFALAQYYWLAQLSRFFTGIGSAFCFLSCIRIASRWFPSERMAVVSGFIVMMAMLGGVVAQMPFTLFIHYVGNWRDSMIADALLGLFFWIIIYFFVRDYPPEKRHDQKKDQQALSQLGYWQSMRASYLKIHNWLCGLYTCFLNLPIYLIGGGGFGALYLQQVKHMSSLQASYPPMMIFLGTVLGSPLVGWLSDKMHRRQRLMQIGALLSLLLIINIIILNIISINIYAVLFFLLGLTSSTQILSYPTVAETNPTILTATAVSVVSFTTLSGGAVFQPLFGYLMDKAHSSQVIHGIHVYTVNDYHRAMYIMPIVMLIALCSTAFIKETYGKYNH